MHDRHGRIGALTTDDKLNALQAITAVAAGIFIGIALTDGTTSEFWLYRYQTIIAGILAIVAAGWTVVEMRRTDVRQQYRHDELMSLNLRADRLRARRAAFPYANKIRSAASLLDESLIAYSDSVDKQREVRSELMKAIEKPRNKLAHILFVSQINDAKDMFGSEMSYNYDEIGDIDRTINKIDRTLHSGSVNAYQVTPRDRYIEQCRLFITKGLTFADHLDQLARYYGE